MTSAVFVHGTGVREEAYKASLSHVADELRELGVLSINACYWGHLASDLHAGGASIPQYDATRSLAADAGADASDEDYAVALWGVLYDDPLYELRVLALRRGSGEERPLGQAAPGAELARIGRRFPVPAALQNLLGRGGIGSVFDEARVAVTASAAYRAALDAAPQALADDRAAVARALIAESFIRCAEIGMPGAASTDSRLRDQIEAALIEALGGAERSIGGWVRQQFLGMVFRLGTPYVARRRGAITDAAYPAAGDILLYQARGQAIRSFILERIQQAPRPRIVVAHSLGGIACVDLLAAQAVDVDLLITVGSQASFLYEIDALQSLRQGEPLPAHFPRWLNIYDLRDFLSYIGTGLFPGRVKDVKVDNGQPFPASHSAYWTNPVVWNAIAVELP
jgi:hypothetical protein